MPGVYDKEKEHTGINHGQHDDLGIGSDQRASETQNLEDQFNAPSAEEPDLKSAESQAVSEPAATRGQRRELDQVGKGFTDEGKGKNQQSGSFIKRKKKWFIGGGVGGGIAGVLLSMLLLLPLKVEHIVNNLQSHFFATSEKASDDMNSKLLESYLVKKVIPGMSKSSCTTTRVNKSCALITSGTGPVANLYNVWRTKNLEEKLAKNQGIEIRKEGNRFYMRSDRLSYDLFSGDFDPKNPQVFEGKVFQQLDRSEVRAEMKRGFENETFAKRVMYRFKVGKLLETKYGIKRCLIACGTRDKVKDSLEERKLAWKMKLVERVVTPRSEMMGLVMECALSGFDCVKSESTGADGDRQTQFETEAHDRIAALSPEDQVKLHDDAEKLKEKGFSSYLLDKITNDLFSKIAGKLIPVVGWVDFASQLDSGLKNLGPGLKKLNYIINSTAMVTMYMMYRSNADEIKTGNVDTSAAGAIADSLGPDAGKDQNGGGAETTPLYGELMGSQVKTASIFTPFIPKAFAAGTTGYTCNDGSTITSGVCPELSLSKTGWTTDLANGVSSIFDSPLLAPLGFASGVWNSTVHPILSAVSGLGSSLITWTVRHLGGGWILDEMGKIASTIAQWIISKLINDPLGKDPSGGRNFDIAAGGADVAGNRFAHASLGAQAMSPVAVNQIRDEYAQEQKDAFNHESQFARIFDTSSDYSLISKVAMALPVMSPSDMTRSFATALLNPFSMKISISTPAASAAPDKDPFGVTQYAYPADDPVFKEDPETYWTEHKCDDPNTIQNWGNSAQDSPDNGMPDNHTTMGCKLILNAVESGGATSGIDPDTGNIGEPSSSNQQPGTVKYTNPVIDGINAPDPTVIRAEDGTYHAFTTGAAPNNSPYQHFTSKDMVHWIRAGDTLNVNPSWLNTEYWAPDVAKTGDHYTLTFAGGGCSAGRKIGYATSKTLDGPFTYQGILVQGWGGCGYDIDPKLVSTDQGFVLYFGSGPQGISAVKLSMSGDQMSEAGNPVIVMSRGSDPVLTEGAWVYQSGSYYYLFYSAGDWTAQGGPNEYETMVARSTSPFGPFEKHGAVLTGSGSFRGPGHNSVTTDDAGTDWIVYHAWHNGNRTMSIDPITYKDGWPTVRDGHPSSGEQEGPFIGPTQAAMNDTSSDQIAINQSWIAKTLFSSISATLLDTRSQIVALQHSYTNAGKP